MENRQDSRKQPFANEARLAKNGQQETIAKASVTPEASFSLRLETPK
jgi:hypothetical protein